MPNTFYYTSYEMYQPLCSTYIEVALKKFEDLIFVNDQLLAKTAKLRPSKIQYQEIDGLV